jgi:hypothetical protein
MSDPLHIRYGDFHFLPGEAALSSVSVTSERNARGYKYKQNVQFDVEGEVCAGDVDDITDRLTEINNALSVDGQDFGLYKSDGTPSFHQIVSGNSNNLTGNQVLYRRWPETMGGEYVDGRKFSFGVGAVILDAGSGLLDFRDSIVRRGTGEGEIEWRLWKNRVWYPQRTAPAGPVKFIHSGSATSIGSYFTGVAPYFNVPFRIPQEQEFQLHGPRKSPQGYWEYSVSWRYVYILPASQVVLPTLR